jgi:hypothetical protein
MQRKPVSPPIASHHLLMHTQGPSPLEHIQLNVISLRLTISLHLQPASTTLHIILLTTLHLVRYLLSTRCPTGTRHQFKNLTLMEMIPDIVDRMIM